MRQVESSAPGKAVLIGEYAVLHGTPALVMALDRRVRVQIRSSLPNASRIEAPPVTPAPIPFRIGPEACLDWLDAQAAGPELDLCKSLLQQTLRAARDRPLPDPGGFQIRIDSSELYQEAAGSFSKLGLGSSAAVTVAFSAALQCYLQDSEPAPISRLSGLLESHRQMQGGRGSGIDLAAALLGGLLLYRLADHGPEACSLDWPSAWPLLFVWTGQAASTGGFLERYARWRSVDPAGAATLWQAMDDCAREARMCVESTALDGFMTCINNYRELMGKIGVCIDKPVLSPQHQRLAVVAREFGAAYKPCGAGGGDVGVFVASDSQRLAQISLRVEAIGFRGLSLGPALTGLQLTLNENDAGPAVPPAH